jgi:hypothetical protein
MKCGSRAMLTWVRLAKWWTTLGKFSIKQGMDVYGSYSFRKFSVLKSFLKRMMEGMNSTMIYGKNFCKCHSVLPVQQ